MVNSCDAEEPIGSERVVGERKLAPREPYGARRTRCTATGVPYPVGLEHFYLYQGHLLRWPFYCGIIIY